MTTHRQLITSLKPNSISKSSDSLHEDKQYLPAWDEFALELTLPPFVSGLTKYRTHKRHTSVPLQQIVLSAPCFALASVAMKPHLLAWGQHGCFTAVYRTNVSRPYRTHTNDGVGGYLLPPCAASTHYTAGFFYLARSSIVVGKGRFF